MQDFYKITVVVMMLVLLIACGGAEGDDTQTEDSPNTQIEDTPETPIIIYEPVSTEVEANNSIEQANLLSVDEMMAGSLNSEADIDWFSFYSSGDIYTIHLGVGGVYNSFSGLSWIATLYDENDNEVYTFQVDKEELVSIDINLAIPGNYYISISDKYSGSFDNETYFLTVTK